MISLKKYYGKKIENYKDGKEYGKFVKDGKEYYSYLIPGEVPGYTSNHCIEIEDIYYEDGVYEITYTHWGRGEIMENEIDDYFKFNPAKIYRKKVKLALNDYEEYNQAFKFKVISANSSELVK